MDITTEYSNTQVFRDILLLSLVHFIVTSIYPRPS